MKIPDNALFRAVRRFAWISLALYGALSTGQWVAHLVGAFGPVTGYTIEISIIGATTFAALYAAAGALKPQSPLRDSTTTET